MAVRVELVVAAFAVLYGCGQASTPVERQEKQGGMEQAQAPATTSRIRARTKAKIKARGRTRLNKINTSNSSSQPSNRAADNRPTLAAIRA